MGESGCLVLFLLTLCLWFRSSLFSLPPLFIDSFSSHFLHSPLSHSSLLFSCFSLLFLFQCSEHQVPGFAHFNVVFSAFSAFSLTFLRISDLLVSSSDPFAISCLSLPPIVAFQLLQFSASNPQSRRSVVLHTQATTPQLRIHGLILTQYKPSISVAKSYGVPV